ncbi:MAG TPA: GldG family protein [Kiritimatiellia bacterium]|nr:GldG family protein [Kiritimatiellia bacterium]HMO97698.1 GldG family protein [Kiritimatiellia bacterium]HMP95558.1 GldG family protein [Kiritimatiellia bacterium]
MAINESDPGVALNRQRMRSRSRRRWLSGLHGAASILLMFILIVMVNYLSSRHYARFDWSRDRFFALSGKSVALLGQLEEPIHVTVFIQPQHELYHHVYDDVLHVLREYEYASGNRLTVERIDPDRHPGKAEAFMSRYDLDRPNVVVFSSGSRYRVVQAEDVTDMDYEPLLRGNLPEKIAFRGEQVFTSAIFSLVEADPPRVYFLQGHGERDFDDHDEYVGLSRIGQWIRRDHIELTPFSFLTRTSLPDDADALIIAGPSRAYSTAEIERITAFAQRAGRILLMLTAETDAGFAPLLRSWGIDSFNNLVIDPVRTLSGFDVLTAGYGDHPITERLKTLNTVFFWPRALPLMDDRREGGGDLFQAVPLAFSSPESWAERDTEARPHRFDPERDIRGPLPLAVAVERAGDVTATMNIQASRVVIFGDADFVSNSGLSGGNGDFFLSALNWILERDYLLDIAPRPFEEIKLMMDRRQLQSLFWFVVVVIPAAVTAAGLLVRWRRRREAP